MQRRGYLGTGSQCLSGRQVYRGRWGRWLEEDMVYHFAKGCNKDIALILRGAYNLHIHIDVEAFLGIFTFVS